MKKTTMSYQYNLHIIMNVPQKRKTNECILCIFVSRKKKVSQTEERKTKYTFSESLESLLQGVRQFSNTA